ncbi:MAG: AAA family ATPase, partial [Polyangiales bacterium]
MRLLELRLIAFGSFTDRTLDLSQPPPAFHLVYGPNEAGKSTALRAILGLFYGIEDRTADDYLHPKPSLRVAARLCDASGQELSVVRRKGKKDTLLDPDGKPIDEALLSRMLGGLPEPLFRSMFGLDHERLRQGGEQLRLGRGDLGESLFQAGVGARGVHDILAALDHDADLIFKPRGQRSLNEAIRGFEDARRRIRDQAKHAEGFRAQEDELAQVR